MNNKTPARSNVVVLKQILNLIPRGMINRHARETGVEAQALRAELSHGFPLSPQYAQLRSRSYDS